MTFNKETEYLLSKFSHELRNPLTTIYATIQLLERQHPEVADFKYWSNLSCDIEYMNQLLTELSDLSKSEHLQCSTFSLRDLLQQISVSFAAMIVDSKVEYSAKIDPSIHQITGDKTKLQEVFLNLLKNAFEAAGPDKSIYLEALQTEDQVTISIRDTGCGISQEQLPTIFDPFVTYKSQGTGLGLAICDHIVRAHKGTISVESSINIGSCFTVILPVNLSLL